MKTLVIQAAAVIIAGAGIGSVAAPWQGVPPQIPPVAVVQSTPTLITPLIFSQVGQSTDPSVTITVQGGPLSGTWTAYQVVPMSPPRFVAQLFQNNGTKLAQVTANAVGSGANTTYMCHACIYGLDGSTGNGSSGAAGALPNGADIPAGVRGTWYGPTQTTISFQVQ